MSVYSLWPFPAPHDRWPVAPPDGIDRIVAATGR